MFISVQISLDEGEFAGDLAGNSTEIAEAVIKAVGGDEAKDTCSVHLVDAGLAGVSIPMMPGNIIPPRPMPPLTESPMPTPTNGGK